MKKQNIAEVVTALVLPVVEGFGYRLWDVEFGKVGADFHLTVTIDKDEGITIDDCERVHRAIDPLLDEADPIESFYYLNVSSPGAERVLRTEAHLLASLGKRIEVRFFSAQDGKKSIRGTLTAADGESITLDGDKVFPRAAVAHVHVVVFE